MRREKKVAKLDVTMPDGAASVDIRLNTESGQFSAKLGNEHFSGDDLSALKAKIKNAASKLCQAKFEPCIVYQLYGVRQRQWDNVDPVVGVRFYAAAISGAAPNPNDPVDCAIKRFRIRASVGNDGVFRALDNAPDAFYPGEQRVIPFTIERWRALESIQAVIDSARERLVEVLGNGRSVGEITGLLDGVGAGGGRLLLGAGK